MGVVCADVDVKSPGRIVICEIEGIVTDVVGAVDVGEAWGSLATVTTNVVPDSVSVKLLIIGEEAVGVIGACVEEVAIKVVVGEVAEFATEILVDGAATPGTDTTSPLHTERYADPYISQEQAKNS